MRTPSRPVFSLLSLEACPGSPGNSGEVGFREPCGFHSSETVASAVVDALARRHAQVTAASGARNGRRPGWGPSELNLRPQCGHAPRIAVDSGFVGGASTQSRSGAYLLSGPERPALAASRRASEKAVPPSASGGSIAQHRTTRSPAGVDGRQHGMAVAEQRRITSRPGSPRFGRA